MKISAVGLLILSTAIIIPTIVFSASEPEEDSGSIYQHSVDTSPLSPLLQLAGAGIWGIHYNYHFTPVDEAIIGLGYMNIHFDFGHTNSPALILGYRRYLWKNLHIEYQIWPCYDEFYEKNEQKYYKSFDLWNEFRVGYQFNFEVKNIPFYTSFQWPFGFGLYAGNKPASFRAHEKEAFENRFFYQFPLLFVGVKF